MQVYVIHYQTTTVFTRTKKKKSHALANVSNIPQYDSNVSPRPCMLPFVVEKKLGFDLNSGISRELISLVLIRMSTSGLE